MMGGVVFKPDCTTELPGLFAAGEDTGGVHGANRLGGNGVANSTVFGGISGETMAAWVGEHPILRAPDEAAIATSIAEHELPFKREPGNLEGIREALFECMWKDVGILRTAEGIERAQRRLAELDAELARTGIPDGDRSYNLSWHDWMNLRSLIAVSRVIAAAALLREDSRGAHFREDFPQAGDLNTSSFTVARMLPGGLSLEREAVRFERVRPGETILQEEPAATH
jgi:fumarate reductase flavoprotein subunit